MFAKGGKKEISKSLFLLAHVLVLSRPEIHTINILGSFKLYSKQKHNI